MGIISKEKISLKSTIGQSLAHILRGRLLNNQYEQGAKMIEEEIAGEFAVSRASVRDALAILETEGLIVREINKCKTVRKFTRKDIEDLLCARSAIETAAALECIKNKLPEAELIKKIESMERASSLASAEDDYDLTASDFGFHEIIISASENRYFIEFWEDIRNQLLMLMNKAFQLDATEFVAGIEGHAYYVKLLKEGDPAKLSEYIHMICYSVKDPLLNSIDEP